MNATDEILIANPRRGKPTRRHFLPKTIRIRRQHGIAPCLLLAVCQPLDEHTDQIIRRWMPATTTEGIALLGGSWLGTRIREVLEMIATGETASEITPVQALAWTVMLDEGSRAKKPFTVTVGDGATGAEIAVDGMTGMKAAKP